MHHRANSIAAALACAAPLLAAAAPGVNVLHGFDFYEGQYPLGKLMQGSDGRLYGTTNWGGFGGGAGTAYAVTTAGAHTVLHGFAGADGQQLDMGLAQLADQTIFGTTPQGTVTVGSVVFSFGGTVFKMQPDGGAFTTLRTFPANGMPDGARPGTLVDGGDGFLYGTMRTGNKVFRIAPDGAFTVLHTFGAAEGSGVAPGLTRGSDGLLYGVLATGPGGNTNGAIFRMTPAGAVTIVHAFNGADGSGPSPHLVESGGAFYGVTSLGGPGGSGTVFRLALDGTVTTLHGFDGANGYGPNGIALAPDGRLHGTTFGGGHENRGTIFRLNTDGTGFLTLHLLDYASGYQPTSGPLIGSDGLLYGTATYGGSGSWGTVWQFDPTAAQPAVLNFDKRCYNEFNMCFKPINVLVGQRFSLVWSSANLDSCTAAGAWSGAKAPAGKLDIVPDRRGIYTYRLDCSGPGGSKQLAVTVTVGGR